MEHKAAPLPFDARTVELKGTNLIEASAGTGKTYSIAILALRLIIEMNIPLKKILMVTFTKAAVAELHERIRLFIKLAYKSVQGNVIEDNSIQSLVEAAVVRNGLMETQQRLYDAVLLLDELSVITIHSFCQQTLTEFAFETKQLFGAEMFTELDDVIEKEVNDFWREYVTTLETDLLELLDVEHLRTALKSIVKDHLEGKQYAPYNDEILYSIHDVSIEALQHFRTGLQEQSLESEQMALAAFEKYKPEIEAICNASRSPKKKEYLAFVDDAKAFISLLNNGKPNVLTSALPEGFLSVYESSKSMIEKSTFQVDYFLSERLNCLAIQVVAAKVRAFLIKNNFLSYNDLIRNLHRSLTQSPNPALVAALQEKYQAVFVDEFQDTDKEQYEIFRTSFYDNTILFLIGDPKQSIYAWRKADIHTYFKARNDVEKWYDMDVNFRSATPFIEAMNLFFLPEPAFNTFAFPPEEDSITYTLVKSPADNKKGVLLFNGAPDIPITIFEAAKKEILIRNVAVQVQALLTDNAYKIESGEKKRSVIPSDIGILVRKNSEAAGVKNYLAQIGIPAVMINDEKIFESQEAKELLYLLEAIFEPDLSAIHKALLNTITGFTIHDILKLDEEKMLHHFQSYKNIWQRNGIYPALQRFLKDFGLKERLVGNHEIQGERVLSNLIQLIELLNQTVHYGALSQDELLSWFRRGVNGMAVQGDEYITRMESDEDAVKIVTIHKSKGLEYNIVLAPFLDMNADNNFDFQRFRDADGNYLVRETVLMTDAERRLNAIQLEQENRRLIYVAITRAVYRCFIFENKAGYYNRSGLKPFVNAVKNDTPLIFKGSMPAYELSQYQTEQDLEASRILLAEDFTLVNENWMKLSYSAMAIHPARVFKERTDKLEDGYEKFVFNQLRFGAASGNLLHQILELVDFSNDTRWPQEIEKALKAYMPGRIEAFSSFLLQLLEHVVNVPVTIGKLTFSLKDIAPEKRIAELEFDFPIEGLQTKLFEKVVNHFSNVAIKSFEGIALDGLMNGKIDLFFEHKGRFYILDWKSNYLGYNADNYNEESLLNAMDENNYHLQYLIYTVALKKYLTTRIPDFDYNKQFGGVIYLFLRGLRKDSTNGVFAARPSLTTVERMEALLHRSAKV
jgi:exodeoxyribonuclease V beta subunit